MARRPLTRLATLATLVRRGNPKMETGNWENGEWKLVLSQLQGLRKDVDPVTGREFRLLRMDNEKAIGCRHPD